MDLDEIMQNVGLPEREIKIYLALLELGDSTVLPIAKLSGIKRTYCYDILDVLVAKSLVTYYGLLKNLGGFSLQELSCNFKFLS